MSYDEAEGGGGRGGGGGGYVCHKDKQIAPDHAGSRWIVIVATAPTVRYHHIF